MLLRSCFICEHHQIKKDGEMRRSFCGKENCWARYSKCVAQRAIERFLDQDRIDSARPFSAIAHVYENE